MSETSKIERSRTGRVSVRSARVLQLAAALVGVCGLTAGRAMADATWTGATNSDYGNTANYNADPNGQTLIINNSSTGVYPVISSTPAFTPVDLRVGTGGLTGRIDQTAGTAGTGNGNWFFLGYQGSSATFNLANTAATGGTTTGFGTGSGSFNVGGTTQNGNLIAGLDNATQATINVNTTGTLAAGGIFLGSAGASTGTMNLDNGTVAVAGDFQVGGNFYGVGTGSGTLNMHGGTLTADLVVFSRGNNNASVLTGTGNITGGTINIQRYLTLGFAGNASATGTLNNSGGTINVKTLAGNGGGNFEVAVYDATTAVYNQSAGTLNLDNNANIGFGIGGNHSGTATFNQSGGTVTFYGDTGTTVGGTGSVILGVAGDTGTYTYNLNGGTLTTPSVTRTATGGTGTFNFGGGTLRPTASSTTFLTGLTAANVRAGGAKIDTNGFDVTVGQALVADTTSTGGGLAKSGLGTLSLAGVNTYTGNTTVSAGTLDLASTGSLLFVVGANGTSNRVTGTGALTLEGAFAFDLTNAAATAGSSWLIDGVTNTTYASTFNVTGFTNAGSGNWLMSANGTQYRYAQSTGLLSVVSAVPEPTVLAPLGLMAAGLFGRRKRAR